MAQPELEAGSPVREVELAGPAAPTPAVDDGADAGPAVLLVVKLHAHVVGTVAVSAHDAADPQRWRPIAARECHAAIAAHLRGDDWAAAVGDLLPEVAAGTPCRVRREALLAAGPAVTVVVATHNRADRLDRCLDALLADRYPRTEVLVVDNAPADRRTEQLVRDRYAGLVRYTREPRPGLAVAHNHALPHVHTPLVAFTDDDVTVDPWWVTSLVAAFEEHPAAAAVTGLIVPDELETPAQVLLERHGAFAKGAARKVFDLHHNRPVDPLFPFTAGQLGSGANMAFRAAELRAAGGFDAALGTGTRARGGDDLAALFTAVAAGHGVVYEPAAVVRHRHHRHEEALARQSFGYGVGLGAYLTSAALAHPRLVVRTARHLPRGFRYAFSSRSERNLGRYDGWPSGLAWRERAGLALGPAAYLWSRLSAARRSAAAPAGAPAR